MLEFINECHSDEKPSREEAIKKIGGFILNIVKIPSKDLGNKGIPVMDEETKNNMIRNLASEWTNDEQDQDKLIMQAKKYMESVIISNSQMKSQ